MTLLLAEDLALQFLEVSTEAALRAVLDSATRQMGFDHYALSYTPRPERALEASLLFHDYPEAWARVYTGFDLAGRDPVRRACDKSLCGFEWRNLGQLIPMTCGDRHMLAVGQRCGVGDGYTVPRHIPGEASGSCSFVVRPGVDLPRTRLMAAEIVGGFALTSARRLAGLRQVPAKPVLSDRQRECVVWSARGKSAPEIAIILGISRETVIQHLKMARERYEVHCRQSLVLHALYDGLVGFADVFRWTDWSGRI